MGWRLVLYGAMLAAGTAALQWLDYQRLARSHWEDIYVLLVAAAFLGLGVFVGARLFGRHHAAPDDGNPQARAALGISPRELEVLRELAAGLSNKEIARRLEVSPNTVKTHVTRLFEKLGARRRTEAIHRARELGIVS
jgi:DNA-binding CsgD family transcriptional regulator